MRPRVFPLPPEPILRSLLARIAMVLLALLAATPAWATTLAVLPLERGATGPELEGLGTALSGMIVSDMAGAAGLTLVERQRLDAVLGEIELGDKGFLDPKTAQRLGKGAGAELVLVGSYSVVGDTLALDARLVEVATAKVLDGAAAQGPVADWVTVEKDLVEALLAELDATLDARGRREFYGRVPTESWAAFQAWSQGAARATAGDLEAARKAFEKALAADPDFQDAVDGLTNLQALIATTRARDTETRTNRYTAVQEAVLAGTVDVRTRKTADYTPEELAGIAIRWAVLFDRREHCQRYDEMIAYLDQVGWDPAAHSEATFAGGPRDHLVQRDLIAKFGYTRWDKSVHHPDREVYESFQGREHGLWDSTHSFVFNALSELHQHKDVGLATSLLECHPPAVRTRQIDTVWRKKLSKHGQMDQLGHKYRSSLLTNAEQLDVMLGWSEAREGAVSTRTMARLEALLARYPDEEESRHKTVLGLLRNIEREADMVDRDRTGLLGLELDVIRTRLEALETGQAPFLAQAGPDWCAAGREKTWAKEAARIRGRWDEELADNDDAYHQTRWAARLVRVAGDMGCFDGVPGRYSSFDDAVAELKTARARKHPLKGDELSCVSMLDSLETTLASGLHLQAPGYATHIALNSHMTLVQLRCVLETPR